MKIAVISDSDDNMLNLEELALSNIIVYYWI